MHRVSYVAAGLIACSLTACGGGSGGETSADPPDPQAVVSCLKDGGIEGKFTSFPDPQLLAPAANLHVPIDGKTAAIDVTFYPDESGAENTYDTFVSEKPFDTEVSRHGSTTVVTVYGSDPQTDELEVIDGCV